MSVVPASCFDATTWQQRLLQVVRRLAVSAPVQQEWMATAIAELQEQADAEERQLKADKRLERFKLSVVAFALVLLWAFVMCITFWWT